jgi:pyridinium-3,5-bisthiocarboxylic acid mononucleotide nickel chelatase
MLAYFDCFSGISGDMTLGALIDIGVPIDWLNPTLQRIPLSGVELGLTSISRMGIYAKRLRVYVKEDSHERHYENIKLLIEKSPLPAQVKETSLKIFLTLAQAEAQVHGCPIEHVHFHEAGGVDAIADIVGTALCLDYLGITQIAASAIPLGSGFVTCRHGVLPLPAPAVAAILTGVPVYGTTIAEELVTPTGAAIIKTLSESFGEMPEMTIEKIGYGAGERNFEDRPNFLRIMTGTPKVSKSRSDEIVVLESNIDDMNPEIFGFLMERLFKDGALDVFWIPVFMKKNRPGTLIQVLCRKEKKDALIARILSETTSLGVRFYAAHRQILAREYADVETVFGKIQMKKITCPDGSIRMIPEYEVCKNIALERNMPLKAVYDALTH